MRKTAKGWRETGARASGREHPITMSEPPRGQAEARVPPAFAFPVNVDVGRRSQCPWTSQGLWNVKAPGR